MNPIEWLIAAKEKMESGLYDEAIELAIKAYQAGETQIAVSKILAHSYFSTNMHSQASQWYKKVLEHQPFERTALINHGICLGLCGNMEESLAMFSEYIRVYPNEEGGYINRGYTLLGLNKFAEAKQDILKAIELNCKSPLVWFYAGAVSYNLQEYPKAEEYLLIASDKMPEHSDSAFVLGNTYYNTAQWQKCIEAMNKALYYDEKKHEALFRRMVAKKNIGDYTGAETDANNLIRLTDKYFKLEKDGKRLKVMAIEVTNTGNINFKVEQ